MVLLVVFLVSMATPQPVVEETSDGDQINRWMHSKRPFCNAFAGNYLCNNQLVQLKKIYTKIATYTALLCGWYDQYFFAKKANCNWWLGCGRKRASTSSEDQSISDFEKAMNNFPRLLNAESKLWDRLYAKLQQRYNKKQYDYAN